MTIQELHNKVGKIIDTMQGNEIGDIMATVGEEALTRIKLRILKSGVDSEGQQYKPYSTKPMLAGCKGFLDKAKCPAKNKTSRKELKWVTIQRGGKNYKLYEIPGGYKEFRDMNLGPGHSSYVDFFFSGRMWQNIKLVKDRNELNNGIATIRATDSTEQVILNSNANRRTSILKLSKSELSDLNNLFTNRVSVLINRQ
jgi:hypothetical protein